MPDTERVSNEAIFAAIAELLDDERQWTKDYVENLNGNTLLKTSSMVLVEAKLKALRARYANIGTRKSKVLSGTPPAALSKLWEQGDG